MTMDAVNCKPLQFETEIFIQPVQASDVPEIIQFDQRVFGANREQLINLLTRNYPEKAWIKRRNGRMEGFVLGRPGTRFHHIGPIMAYFTEAARELL